MLKPARTVFTLLMGTAATLAFSTASAQEDMPNQKELWKMIQEQKKLIDSQQKQIESLAGQIKQADKKADAATQQVSEVKQEQKKIGAVGGAGAASGNGWWERTQLGGYGELHYNGGEKDEIDFHRFVLMGSHQFNDKIRLFTELELEHSVAGEGKEGEIELEQAFIEYDLTDTQHARAGVFLLPIGIMNEKHEPNTFFGVERNPVETNIIPTTWWEGGVGLNGEIGNGFSYDVAAHSGLNTPTTGSNAFKIRNGRQKVSEARAEDGAVTGRLKWTGMTGVELAASTQYQQDIAQGNEAESISATLFETHANVRKGPIGFRALYARWDLEGNAPEAVGRDEQFGWYAEPGYYFDTPAGEVGLFTRYSQWDNEAGDSTGSKFKQTDFGVNFWPHENVVLKADIQLLDVPAGGNDDEILNLGVGYQF